MCDCYWAKCSICKRKTIPVHIADFCMPRDNIKIYCKNHIPQKDVVIHTLIENEYHSGGINFPRTKNRTWIGYRAGWKMGVRYVKKPPEKYGYTAVTPNIAAAHIAKIITKSKKSYWITEWITQRHGSETGAIEETIKKQNWLSPIQQTWRRYLLKLKGEKLLEELNAPGQVIREIKCIVRNLKRRYKDLRAIVLIGSFAEGNYKKDSDIDLVFINKRKVKYQNLFKLADGIKRRVQLIPFTRKILAGHFRDSTTMAYALQRGGIIYQKKEYFKIYSEWPLSWPDSEWVKSWFRHWERIYDYGVEDFKKSKKIKFDNVTDRLPRGVVNFGILFLETKGYIPTTKRDLAVCFEKEIKDEKIKESFRTALKAHHEGRNISLDEAEKIFISGEFLRKELKRYSRELEKRKKRYAKIQHGAFFSGEKHEEI